MTTLTAPPALRLPRGAIHDLLGPPNPAQRAIIDDPARFKLMAGGVRAGKSWTAARAFVLDIMEWLFACQLRDGDARNAGDHPWWIVASEYPQTRAEFDYVAAAFVRLGMLVARAGNPSRGVDPGTIEIDTGDPRWKPIIIKTKSAIDYHKLNMEAPRGILVCEAAQLELEAFWRLMERSSENRASIFLSGTFEGSLGWYPATFTRWQSEAIQKAEDCKSFSLPSWTNEKVFPGGRNDPEILKLEREHSTDWFNERVAAIPSPPTGLVHPSFDIDVHVREVEVVPGQPVYIAIDPGYSRITDSAYAVALCQLVNGQIRVFDEVYEQEHTTHDIIQMLVTPDLARFPWRTWWKDCPKVAVIDQAAKAHSGTGVPVAEIWGKDAGIYPISNYVPVLDGIERFNSLLKFDPVRKEPGIVISPRCKGLISELGGGLNPFTHQVQVYKWNVSREGSVQGQAPRDKFNHAIKAITYLAVHLFGYATAKPREKEIRRVKRHRDAERDLRDMVA